jgi:4-amino-4-deoxy-L-arabinose transferase-like glycosyltransferase
MLREDRRFFLWAGLGGLALRLFFLVYFPAMTDDSRVYIDLANNWLQHGVYGQTDSGQVVPGDTRLPGYPAFLAAIFSVFGAGKIEPVFVAQILIDLGTCLIIADLARRMIAGRRAGRVAFLLAALCPFLANHATAILTETLEVFFTAVALNCAAAALDQTSLYHASLCPAPLCQTTDSNGARPGWPLWAATGGAVAACILLRPDGGILLGAIGLYLLLLMWRDRAKRAQAYSLLLAGALVALISLAPLAPWTVRNWKTLHEFQPLAPRYATEPEEVTPRGFNRWARTWMADYASVEEIYWNVPGDKIDADKLPRRALDSAGEATLALIADYNVTQQLTPQIDARFDQVAEERIRAHPFRYYIELPVMRVADMWLRPRTELMPSDPRWWEFNDDTKGTGIAVGLGVINLFFVGAATLGLIFRRSDIRYVGLLVVFLVVRSAFLGTIENPETRYTLECYPAIIVLASALFAGHRAPDSTQAMAHIS